MDVSLLREETELVEKLVVLDQEYRAVMDELVKVPRPAGKGARRNLELFRNGLEKLKDIAQRRRPLSMRRKEIVSSLSPREAKVRRRYLTAAESSPLAAQAYLDALSQS